MMFSEGRAQQLGKHKEIGKINNEKSQLLILNFVIPVVLVQ